jgi:Xaa-Pro dipeptidase
LHSHSEVRIAALCEAQGKAELLFRQVEERGLIRAGITEHELNEAIFALAEEIYGIRTYWHKRIVRAGKNILLPYAGNPPDLVIGEDEILFLDLGPVFEEWEADFGRTFVLGSDPFKHKMRQDIGEAFADGKKHFNENPKPKK